MGRLLPWGWSSALALGLAACAFAGEVSGHFGGGPILVRPWMETYNLVINLCQLLALSLLAVASLRLPSGRAQKLAALAFASAASLVLAMLLFPIGFGGGPWSPDAPQVKVLRALVFAPGLLRTLGLAATATAILPAPWLVLSLLCVDAVLVCWKWMETPRAVMACVHPFCDAPLGLVPWAAATVIFLWLSRRTARTRC